MAFLWLKGSKAQAVRKPFLFPPLPRMERALKFLSVKMGVLQPVLTANPIQPLLGSAMELIFMRQTTLSASRSRQLMQHTLSDSFQELLVTAPPTKLLPKENS